MKAGRYLFIAGLFLVGAMFTCGPTFAWSDTTMPHFGKDANCSDHLVDPTPLGNPPHLPETMYLCATNSGATSWSFVIVRNAVPPVTACTMSSRQVPVGGKGSSSCNFTTAGTYKGTINYCVGSSCFNGHADSKWTIP